MDLNNKIVIYPTDTVYGIGCDALNFKLVDKIRILKERDNKPFSVIAPSKEWILKNMEVDDNIEREIDEKLPGPYTFILKIKSPELKNINNIDTLGIRIINHPFQEKIKSLGKPFITTSVNKSGEKNMQSFSDISPEMAKNVDLIMYEGEINGKSSTILIYDYEKGIFNEIKRK